MKKIILDFSKQIKDFEIVEDTKILGIYENGALVPEKDNKLFEKFNFNINVLKPNINLKIIIKSVLNSNKPFIFHPKVIINKNTKNVSAEMSILILNEGDLTNIDVTPSLEISENELFVNHKLVIMNFEEDKLNYIRSRGLSLEESKNVLKTSFLKDIIDEINNDHE